MKVFSVNGAMYVEVEESDILKEPIELGNGVISPGEYVSRLGEKKRSSFEMQEGWYLKYVGRVDDVILFDTNGNGDSGDIYYAFHYINKNLLLVTGGGSGYDIRINELEKHQNVRVNEIHRQLSLL